MRAPPDIDGYTLVRELGRGSMGVVYLARDRVLEREVAIKIVAESGDAGAIERFLREARATARLSHPNVVTVYRAGVASAEPYLVMELLRGRSLQAMLESDGPLSPERLFEVALGAARGLASAHARGIVHRDIKPSNLFETDERTVKVLDFGIAKVLPVAALPDLAGTKLADTRPEKLAETWKDLTIENQATFDALGATNIAQSNGSAHTPTEKDTRIGGTPLFMSPEVWRQEPADHAADVWSLGATLFTLATGSPPFNGKTIPEIAFNVLIDTPAAPVAKTRKDIPPAFAAVVDRALAKKRADRYASAGELLTALERVARDTRPSIRIEGSPYPGLRPMTGEDRERFFGREEDVARVIERLRSEALVVLVGPSGTGKSSLAAAGVAPAIEEGALGRPARWKLVRFAPGRTPIGTLAHALAPLLERDADLLATELRDNPDGLARALRTYVGSANQGVLVLVDQLEELVTIATIEERDAVAGLLGRLVDLSPPGVRVLATARSDLFDRLGALGDLGALLGRSTELVRPLANDSLRAAITEPAKAVGAHFEDDSLVGEVVSEASTSEAALPLVAFAMRAWWERRDRETRTLTRAGWREVGGVIGALGAHAEQVFGAFSAAEAQVARAVLLRLVGSDGTRRYAVRQELLESAGEPPLVRSVIAQLERARLVQTEGEGDRAQVTVVHEALARAWPRFVQWQRDGREDRSLHERLRTAAQVWEASGMRSDLLWRGSLLAEVIAWRVVYEDTLSPLERRFADASQHARNRERRRRSVGVLVGLAAVVATALLVFETGTTDRAEATAAERDRAGRVLAVRAESLAMALRERDPSSALAWLATAVRDGATITRALRLDALALATAGAARRFACTAPPAISESTAVALCPLDTRVIAIDSSDGSVRSFDLDAPLRASAVSPSADALAWADVRGAVFVRATHGDPEQVMTGVDSAVRMAVNDTGDSVAVLETNTGRVRATGGTVGVARLLGTLAFPAAALAHAQLALTPHALTIFVPDDASFDVRRFTLDAVPLVQPTALTTSYRVTNFARDGALMIYTDADGRIHARDLDGDQETTCAFKSNVVRALAASSDAHRVAWLSDDGAVTVLGIADTDDCLLQAAVAPVHFDALAIPSDRAIDAFGTTLAARRYDLVRHTWSDPRGPSAGTEAPVSVLGAASGVYILAGADGRAVLRGPSGWSQPLGMPGAHVVDGAVDASSGAAVLMDDLNSVSYVPPPPLASVERARWLASDRRSPAADADVRVTALPDRREGVVAAGVGAIALDAHGAIDWHSDVPNSVAVDARGRFGLLGLRDGSAERVDFIAHGAQAYVGTGTTPRVLAVSDDGATAAIDGADSLTVRDLSRPDWPSLPFATGDAPEHTSALDLTSDALIALGDRIEIAHRDGTISRGALPTGSSDETFTTLSRGSDDTLLVGTRACDAWWTRCDDHGCTAARIVGTVCRGIAVDDAGALAIDADGSLRWIARRDGESATVLPAGTLTDDATAAPRALDVNDDAIVLAGGPSTPFVARLALPPSDRAAFMQWLEARTTARVDQKDSLDWSATH